MKTAVSGLAKMRRSFSTFLILLTATVFFAFGCFLYARFQLAVLQTIAVQNNLFMEQVNTISTSLMDNIKSSAMQMFYTSSVESLRTGKTITNSESIYGLRDLGNFVSSTNFLDSVMVYNSKADLIFTSESSQASVSSRLFHDRDAAYILTHPMEYSYLTPIKRESADKSTWSFLFFEYRDDDTSALLLNVNEKWFTSHLLGVSGGNDCIIIDKSGGIIAAADDTLTGFLEASWPSIEAELKSSPASGFLMPPVFSSQPGWMYHHALNAEWYYLRPVYLETTVPGLLNIRNFLFLFFGIFCILLVVFTTYMLVKLYLPLRKIRDILNRSGGGADALSMEVEQLVIYRHENRMAQDMAQLYSGILPSGFDFPALLLDAHTGNAEGLRGLVRGLAPGALDAASKDRLEIGIPSCGEGIRQKLLQQLENFGEGRFYVSVLCRSGAELKRSHEALEELRRLHVLYPERAVLREELLDSCNRVSSLKTKEVPALVSALKSGNPQSAYQQWLDIFSCIRRDRYSDFCFAIRYLGKQLNAFILEYGLDIKWDSEALLQGFTDIADLHQKIEAFFNRLSELARLKKQEQLKDMSVKIKAYIESNYTDPEFSSQSVAEHFQMNPAYLSRQYQKISALSISEEIHQCRIRQARLLLKATDEPVELVAQRVGYSNIKYFFVLFKKSTGKTPTQYRRETAEYAGLPQT